MIYIQQKMHRGDVDDNMPHPEFWWSRSAVGCLVRQPVGRRQAGTFFPGELDDIVDVDVDIDDDVEIDDDVDIDADVDIDDDVAVYIDVEDAIDIDDDVDVYIDVEDAVDIDDNVDVARKGCRVSCLPTCWSRAPDRPRGPRLGGALFLQPTPNAQLQPFLA